MKEIIPPVDKLLLKQELSGDKFLRPTNKAHNEIYIIDAHNSPHVMREIGRLRELSFRTGGGGTGEEIDVDTRTKINDDLLYLNEMLQANKDELARLKSKLNWMVNSNIVQKVLDK